MNRVMKATIFNLQSNHLSRRAALFHSTPVLESKRRSHWKSSKKHKKQHGKREVLRNLNAYADYILQGWKDRFKEDDDPSSMRGPSWFTKQYHGGSGREGPQWPGSQGRRHWGRRAFEFCEDDDDDDDVETIFRSSFDGGRFFYFSFIDEESPRWRSSFGYSKNHRKSWNWRYQDEEDYYDSSSESEMPESSDPDMASDRLALGLRAYGPITLEDVKTAYRACALKWHPDRHQGSYKQVIAEEKFKLCSSAYQSLCDKLAVN
ncbi:hypothetical protein SLEP1_g35221 [Rubroshorea leprosula]|uniref:J domain-containing protein n=1 Tax=Rubroshorea leprosula TaxID=152421 RepID=A0AAV5KN00_9ROSI|nr:hypothetical protein SLEP1_g35221 [Rubroshorea leprosula]